MSLEERKFSLPAGRLYVGEGILTEEALRVPGNYAGPTDGGVLVTVSASLWEIRDEQGALADTIRWGETTAVSGRLNRFSASMLGRILGRAGSCDLAEGENGRRSLLSVLLVCPLPNGEEFTVTARCAPSGNTDFSLAGGTKRGIGFVLRTGCGVSAMTLREPDPETEAATDEEASA